MTVLHADFETRSVIDLKARGLDVYANHPSTDLISLAVAFDDAPAELVAARSVQHGSVALTKSMDRVLDHVRSDGLVYAHNAPFEFTIWNTVCVPRYGWPPLKLEQMRCSMAMALAMSFPGKLEELVEALRLDVKKDMAGHRVMQQISRPRKKPAEDCPYCHGDGAFMGDVCDCVVWWEDLAKYQTVFDYNVQDVEAERAACDHLRELSDFEQRVWIVDQKINRRGVHFDAEAARAALDVVADERQRLNERMFDLTGGAVTTCTNAKALATWVSEQGVPTDSVAKAEVLALLEDEDLPDNVRAALLLRQEAGKSSLAKLDKALEVLGPGGRLRNTKQYHSATTGRWGGRGVQLDNLVRPPPWMKKPELQDEVLRNLVRHRSARFIDFMYGAPMDVLTYCVRAFFGATPGKTLIAPDYSNVEGRKIAWLAGEEWKLQAFRDADAGTGPGIYELTYSRSFNVPVETVTPDQRQIGKVCELALGFGGGVGAFQAMARVYNVQIEDEQADVVKNLWREQHKNIVNYWYALERAAINAVMTGNQFTAGAAGREVTFRYRGDHLWCRLPSGRVLCYPHPEVRVMAAPWGQEKETLTFMCVPGDDPKFKARVVPDSHNFRRWVRIKTYGGSLSENCLGAGTRVFTQRGLKAIERVTANDLVFDGVEWVACNGAISNGEQETIEWLGIHITPDHLIHDGASWSRVIDLDEPATQRALSSARALTASLFCLLASEMTARQFAAAIVALTTLSRLDPCAEKKQRDAQRAATPLPGWNGGAMLTSSPTPNSETCGCTAAPASSRDASTRTATRIRTTADAELACTRSGETTHGRFCGTPSHSLVGTIRHWISTASRTMATTFRAIFGSSPERPTRAIAGAPSSSSSEASVSRSCSSGESTALSGEATTRSAITSRQDGQVTTFTRSTARREPVYDILNAGPRHRFMVLTDEGPVLVHNCTQASARDLLAEALVALDDAGHEVVMHVHDEAVCEVPFDAPDATQHEIESLMCQLPPWATGLPLVSEAWRGTRYRKD